MEVAIVIGNGESRRQVDLQSFKGIATLIGCNAIHRDFDVDHIVCCDQRMVRETIQNTNSLIQNIYTREKYHRDFNKLQGERRVKRVPDIPYEGNLKPDIAEHWGSGPYAVLLAATMNVESVNLIGFDLYGKEYLVNNVYKGTSNYLAASASAVDPSYWVYQIRKVFTHFPNVQFNVFNEDNWQLPPEWNLANVQYFDIKNFNRVLCNN